MVYVVMAGVWVQLAKAKMYVTISPLIIKNLLLTPSCWRVLEELLLNIGAIT